MLGLFSTLFSGISAVINAVGIAVAKVATGLSGALSASVELAKVVFDGISRTVVDVAKVLVSAPIPDDLGVLGAKVIQENTRPIEAGESMEDYFNYLHNEVELDREKYAQLSEQEKLDCKSIGIGMVTESVSEKTDVTISSDFLLNMQKMDLSGAQMLNYLKGFSNAGFESMDTMTKFLKGNLPDGKMSEIFNIIVDAEKKINSNISEKEVFNKILDMKESINEV
ncbi:MAG: hypothetical protein MJZ99_01220 [Bacteroidales bacterium]|nr:hypothetical protein [Bacteroidales bacterium]